MALLSIFKLLYFGKTSSPMESVHSSLLLLVVSQKDTSISFTSSLSQFEIPLKISLPSPHCTPNSLQFVCVFKLVSSLVGPCFFVHCLTKFAAWTCKWLVYCLFYNLLPYICTSLSLALMRSINFIRFQFWKKELHFF